MIASKIGNPKKSSGKAARVAGVVDYITEPENVNSIEKCIHSEAVNFLSHDLKSQKAEMTALAQEAVRSKDPIDHWVLSWKENERPTPEQAREAAAIFIKQCGLKGHQYVYGSHDDTDNMHVHIAVNRVHPDTGKVVKINKGFDREAGHQAIAIIEKLQGWSVEENARYRVNEKAELVIDPATKRPQIFENKDKQQEPTAKAQAMEIQTGEKSAQRIGIEQAAPIIAQAQSWKELHAAMAAAGMQYERKGSGAVVQVGAELVKASDVARTASLSALQKRLGPYQPPQEIKPNEYHHHTPKAKEPHPVEAGKEPGNRLRSLSKCNLAIVADQGKARRAGVLHIDVRAGGRPADGLRRDAGHGRDNSKLIPQPLKENQPGWKEYIAIRDSQRAAKAGDTLAMQKSQGTERAALAAKQKAERDELFSGNWKGKGEAKNLLKSTIATQQAAENLELQERHREERKALQAQYKPLPMYKQWKEQPQIVGLKVLPLIDQHITRDKQVTVAQTLRVLTNNVDARQHITYRLNNKDVFRDEGRTIAVLDLQSERGIAAALAVAQQKFGQTLELTGSDEFKRNAVAVAVANNLTCKFADPELEKLREQLQAKQYQAAREAARAERDREAAAKHLEQLEKRPPQQPPTHPSTAREAVLLAPAPVAQQPDKTLDVEVPAIDYLADIQQQIEASKVAANRHSMLAHSTTTKADYDAPGGGVIVASNDEFVAVQQGQSVTLYQTIELAKRMTYDGIDTGNGRFAPGNELARKNGKDGMRTLIIEEREHMQTEEKRKLQRENSRGI